MSTPVLVIGDKVSMGVGSASNFHIAVLSPSKVVATYHASQDQGRAIVGTIDGFDQTWGSVYEYVDPTGTVTYSYCCNMGDDRVLPVWRNPDDYDGQGIIGLVSGTSISFGSQGEFTDGYLLAHLHKVQNIDSSTAVIVYRDYQTTGSGVAVVAKTSDPSGTTLTFGTPVTFANYDIQELSVDKIGESGVIIGFERNSNNYIKAIVGSVSGTEISFGSEYDIVAAGAGVDDTAIATLTSEKAIIAYRDGTDGSHGKSKVISVSGTTITAASPAYEFTDHVAYRIGIAAFTENYPVVVYADFNDFSHKYCMLGTVSGTAVTWGSGTQFGGLLGPGNAEALNVYKLDSSYLLAAFEEGAAGAANVFYLSGIATAVEGRPMDWLLKTHDHNPQIVGLLDGAASANIQVWNVTNGQNVLVDVSSSGCYQIGDTGRWAWSTANLPVHTGHNHYFYQMIADNSETFTGQFIMLFPEDTRRMHPRRWDGYMG